MGAYLRRGAPLKALLQTAPEQGRLAGIAAHTVQEWLAIRNQAVLTGRPVTLRACGPRTLMKVTPPPTYSRDAGSLARHDLRPCATLAVENLRQGERQALRWTPHCRAGTSQRVCRETACQYRRRCDEPPLPRARPVQRFDAHRPARTGRPLQLG